MQLKQLFEDEDAVSPVIGVILMVAITVILAAVIGTFVLGLGDNVKENGPTANFQFEYNDMDTATGTMDITHNGGQDVESGNVVVNIAGTELDPTNGGDGFTTTWPATISTGDKLTFDEDTTTENFASGDEVRIIWESPAGGSSSTIGQSQIP